MDDKKDLLAEYGKLQLEKEVHLNRARTVEQLQLTIKQKIVNEVAKEAPEIAKDEQAK